MFRKIFITVLFFSSIILAQEARIEKQLNDCLENNSSTIGMSDCYNAAINEWDKELNECYKKLTSLLDKTQKDKLKEAQREWIAFRDINDKFIISQLTCEEGYGTIVQILIPQMKMNTIKFRALELNACCNFIKERKIQSGFSDTLHGYDKYFNGCLKSAVNDGAKIKCIKDAAAQYDKSLNEFYKKVKSGLPDSVQKELVETQRIWIKFRQKSDEFIKSISVDEKDFQILTLNTLRHRAIEFVDYYGSKHLEE